MEFQFSNWLIKMFVHVLVLATVHVHKRFIIHYGHLRERLIVIIKPQTSVECDRLLRKTLSLLLKSKQF